MEDVFKTNFHGPLNIMRALLPKLRAKGTGTLFFVGSQAGAVEGLAKELDVFTPGIKVLLVEPGYFRTSTSSNAKHIAPRVDVYAEFNQGVKAFEQSVVGNEPGDAAKAVTQWIKLTKGIGMAAGGTIPLRVPLGTDGLTRMRAKCEETLKNGDWKDVAKITDI